MFAWTDASTDNQAHFEEWMQAWAMTEGAAVSPFDTDLGAAWAKIDMATSVAEVPVAERPAAKIIHLSKIMRRWSVAAAVLLAIGAGLWWMSHPPVAQQPQFVEIHTLDNERKSITLPDSSEVWLNENSKLTYDPRFAQRHVTLEGEAFFEVERLVERPFEITSGDAVTTVLGTSFNVHAGLGLRFKISKKRTLGFQPVFSYRFGDIETNSNPGFGTTSFQPHTLAFDIMFMSLLFKDKTETKPKE